MKVVTKDNQDKWTSCELRRLIKMMDVRQQQALQLDYFDDEMTEHLNDNNEASIPVNNQK